MSQVWIDSVEQHIVALYEAKQIYFFIQLTERRQRNHLNQLHTLQGSAQKIERALLSKNTRKHAILD